ncbi:MAG: metallophosphoesterase [Phycisphaerae bacterium]|nr:metallophosphoesterase [Phycisphaerae bacterium]
MLVIGDVHYAPSEGGADEAAGPRCCMGRELIRRAIEDAKLRGGFEAIALMGDLLADGDAPWAAQAYGRLQEEIRAAADAPLLVVPGNHDNAQQLLTVFHHRPGLYEIASPGGARYRFVTFADPYAQDDSCIRRREDRQLFRKLAGQSAGPIVVLQHNPINPVIDDEYPYMLTNRREVMSDYAEADVLLSISGHFHAGQKPSTAEGVNYFTAPALCERPFHYTVVTLRGREVHVEIRGLVLDGGPPVVDRHAHTEFAYCGSGISAALVLERAETFGLAGVCLVEHAPQLYMRAEDYWQGRHIVTPAFWRAGEHSRMGQFKSDICPLRSGSVRVGLEVELDVDGALTVRDEDRDWPDLLVGAIHWLHRDDNELSNAERADEFMRINETILTCGVDVLAHPLRFMRRKNRKAPTELYAPLADVLADTNTAAEINFHNNAPDPVFFAACLERGVKLALGSDAHEPYEVAAFAPHFDLLGKIVPTNELASVLYAGSAGR